MRKLILICILLICSHTQTTLAAATSASFDYHYSATYDVYCKTGFITSINLSPAEEVIYVGAGDSTRWVIDLTQSAKSSKAFLQLLVKPMRDDLQTNLIINTNKRSYQINLISTTHNYNNYVDWRYADEKPIENISISTIMKTSDFSQLNKNIQKQNTPPVLNKNYEIKGKSFSWKPLAAFDDGSKTFILMPKLMQNTEAPALFMRRNDVLSLINYRVKDNYYIIDRLVANLEMRVGKDIVKIQKGKIKKDEVSD